ncbi:MAG: VTT domain-containing protein [Patescibacteria group bacterium]|nr:VTT domain-containing protein [Patescibacteria group bacterium]
MELKKIKSNSNKIVPAVIFVLSILSSIAFFIFRDFFKESISLGLLGIFIINFVSNASFFISAPSFFAVIAGGAIYPLFFVALVASLGASLGDMLSFIVGSSGRRLLSNKFNKKIWYNVLVHFFKKHGSWVLFIAAFVPNPIFDSFGILAGVLGFSPIKYFIIVFIARFFKYLIFAKIGTYF